jgi:gliding motility-associated-like protein
MLLRLLLANVCCFFTFFTLGQSSNVNNGCVPLSVNFQAPVSSSTYYWDFKDGSSSTLANPTNIFLNPGTYQVEFKESASGPVINTITITVSPKPTIAFTFDKNKGCAPLTVNFTDQTVVSSSVTITEYTWVFTGGGIAKGANPSYTFNEGNHDVSLEIKTTSPSCNSSKKFNKLVTATNRPQVGFSGTPASFNACNPPLNLSLTNTSTSSAGPLTYTWHIDGKTFNGTNPPSQTFNNEGTFDIKLIATDTNSCTDSASRKASVGAPKANFEVEDTVCKGETFQLVNISSGGTPVWNFPTGVQLVRYYQNGNIAEVFFSKAGTFDLKLTVLSGNCSDDTTISVVVDDPKASFTSTPTYLCDYPASFSFTNTSTNASSYNWYVYNKLFSNEKDPTLILKNPDSLKYDTNKLHVFNISLRAITSSGCQSVFQFQDTVDKPNALFFPSVSKGCLPLKVSFADSSRHPVKDSINQWKFFFGDGNSLSTTKPDTVTYTYNTEGTFEPYMVVYTSGGCTDTSFAHLIEVGDKLSPDFAINKTTACLGDTVQFTDLTPSADKAKIDAWHYYADDGHFFHCDDNANPAWIVDEKLGSQSIKMTVEYNGCFSDITKSNILQVDGAKADIFYTYDCSKPYEVNFVDNSTNHDITSWDFGNGVTATVQDTTITYNAKGNYKVKLSVENSLSACGVYEDTITVRIQDIKADFTIDSLICRRDTVVLDAQSSEDVGAKCYKGYRWLFSDDKMKPVTTERAAIENAFLTSGVNYVTLITTDVNGCKDSISKLVRVYGIDLKYAVTDSLICAPTTVGFINNSTHDTTISAYIWNFSGYGSDTSLVEDTTQFTFDKYNRLGYNIIFKATDVLGCEVDTMLSIDSYIPKTTFTASDFHICSGDTVDFIASDFTAQGSSLNFIWDFKDGDSSFLQSPSHIFNGENQYNVGLTIEEKSTGCKNFYDTLINVVDTPDVDFNIPGFQQFICPGTIISFEDLTNPSVFARYSWNFGNGETSTLLNPGTLYQNNGTYTVTLNVDIPQPYGCGASASKQLIVREPKGSFKTDKYETLCRLDELTFTIKDTSDVGIYRWNLLGDTITGLSPFTYAFPRVPENGTTVAKLVMSNIDGSCPVTKDSTINIYEVIADFRRNNGTDTAICFAPYTFTNTSLNADQFYWDLGNGTQRTTKEVGTINYAMPDTFLVTLGVRSSQFGCTDTTTKEVILHPIPEFTLVGDTICEFDNGLVSITSGYNSSWIYQWNNFPDYDSIELKRVILNGFSRQFSPPRDTRFVVSVIDSNQCAFSDEADLFVFNPLDLPDYDTAIVIGDIIQLPVRLNAGLYNFSWDPSEGLSCLDCLPPSVQPLEDILYTLTIEDKKGCFTDVADYYIKVYPETFVKLPTSFTPNGDGNNDLIYVKGWGIKELLSYEIFNRWGEKVFSTEDINEGWDGRKNGVLQNNDVYVFQVRAMNWRDEEIYEEGYINLLK